MPGVLESSENGTPTDLPRSVPESAKGNRRSVGKAQKAKGFFK